MGKKTTIESPQWKRLFFTGLPVASRHGYLGISLPEIAALSRYYDWQEGDFPGPDDTVQWLLLFEYVHFTTKGNWFFQRCCASAPPPVKRTLLQYLLRRLYPEIAWNGPLPDGDPDWWLPAQQGVLMFGGAPFYCDDVPFMTDSSVPWPAAASSGAFPVDGTHAVGQSVYLPVDLHFRRSLRSTLGGEIGPTIIVRNKNNALRERFEERFFAPLPARTEATMHENTPVQSGEISVYRGAPPVDPTFVEREETARRFMQSEGPGVPLTALPGHDDSIFLVSGMTQGILGRGGMGMVYKILIKELEVFHALKILHPADIVADPQEWNRFCRRFLREAKLLANLHHTHIAQIHGFGEWNTYPYIEMEYVDGSDIKSMLASGKPIALPAVTGITIQVARALCHAHNRQYILDGRERHGLIHRDLKPQNIMVSKDGESKLLDFGVAMPVGNVTGTVSSSSFVGTLQYASPEQIAGADLDLRTDIHSLGQVMYEMIAGKPAFAASNIQQIIRMKLNNEHADLNDLPVRIPKTLRHTIKTCMQRDPDRRFRTADDLLSVLEEVHHEMTGENSDAVVREYVSKRHCTPPPRRSGLRWGRGLLGRFLSR
jgi:hypothetical protein